MSDIIVANLQGKVSLQAIFNSGCGVAKLDEPYGRFKLAVINDETAGRLALMNLARDGGLPVGQKVLITKVKEGYDALIALEVIPVTMSPFEEFSAEISKVAELYPKSWLVRMFCRIEYLIRRWKNEPLCFKWVGDEGTPVGKPVEVIHLRLHDMMEHQAAGIVTGKVLLEGMRANAIQRLGCEYLDKMHAKTTIQPRCV